MFVRLDVHRSSIFFFWRVYSACWEKGALPRQIIMLVVIQAFCGVHLLRCSASRSHFHEFSKQLKESARKAVAGIGITDARVREDTYRECLGNRS